MELGSTILSNFYFFGAHLRDTFFYVADLVKALFFPTKRIILAPQT